MTILIVGGAAQGKTSFAKEISRDKEIVDDLHLIVRDALLNNQAIPKLGELLGKTVVCNELGCGVVPIDAFEREWREQTGRLCCDIAARADKVYRICCGIPQCIKEHI